MGLFRGKKHKDAKDDLLTFRVRNNYLPPAHNPFFKTLQSAVGTRYLIFPRVNLRDIFYVQNQSEDSGALSRFSEMKVDFLLCDLASISPVLGLQLEDDNYQLSDGQEKDEFIDDLFETAGLGFVRVYAADTYDSDVIKERILEALGLETGQIKNQPPAIDEPKIVSTPVIDELKSDLAPVIDEPKSAPAPVEDELISSSLPRATEVPSDDSQPEIGVMATEKPEEPSREIIEIPTDQQDLLSADDEMFPVEGQKKENGSGETAELPYKFTPRERIPFAGIPGSQDREKAEIEQSGAIHRQYDTAPSAEEVKSARVNRPASPREASRSIVESRMNRFKSQWKKEALDGVSPAPPPDCPTCGTAMVLRTSKRGSQFYSCANFPRCREVRGIYET